MAGTDSVEEWHPICLQPHLDLCLMSGLLWCPLTVKGWADRQTYKQPAFISLSETWQQRAQLHHHTPLSFPLFSSFIFSVTPSCWRGDMEWYRGVLTSFSFTASSLASYSCFLRLAHRLNATAEGSDTSNCLDLLEADTNFPPASVTS